ncbi:MAG: hypothetical protein HRF49_11180 [bacterium]|jgi:hypothetical protein
MFYHPCQAAHAGRRAEALGKAVYTWCTTGRSNWLERGFHVHDVAGYVLMPSETDEWVEMEEDGEEPPNI